jgi:hypothetical protein
MSVRNYVTDEKCPNCDLVILNQLCNHVYSEGGKDFEYECPGCGGMLSIEVEPVPAFAISRLERPNTVLQSDLGGTPSPVSPNERDTGEGFGPVGSRPSR